MHSKQDKRDGRGGDGLRLKDVSHSVGKTTLHHLKMQIKVIKPQREIRT